MSNVLLHNSILAFYGVCFESQAKLYCRQIAQNLTTVKVAADWASDSASDWASDWASHSTVFNHSKVDYLNPFFWLLLRYFLL